MLTFLRVRDFAIIDELEVDFEAGLNVITGETGAGKSILVQALQLVLGERGRAEVVRTGAEAALVEALFDVSDDPGARQRLEDEGHEAEAEVALRRVNQATGRTRAWVNGRLTTAGQLRRLSTGLVDISSQHQHHSLVDPATHLGFLDAYGRLLQLRGQVEAAWGELVAAQAAVDELVARSRARTDREDLLRYQLGEIDAIAPGPGEDEALHDEQSRLRHAEDLRHTARGVEGVLYEGEGAICARLSRQAAALEGLAGVEPRFGEWAALIDSARVELEEVSRSVGRYGRDVLADPARLAEVEDRLVALRRLARKYGGSLDSVIAHQQAAREELDGLGDLELRLDARLEARQAALDAAARVARELSARRREVAAGLGSAIATELASLGMGEARVQVDVAPLEGRCGPEVDGACLSGTGLDRVEFLIAPNPGEVPRPLRRVASGGELSRSLLALKKVLSGVGPVGTYVFDEVDSGVGGAVADAIGRKLRQVSRHHQVLCVTHLPQIAAHADAHFHVVKRVDEGRTRSTIRRLGQGERVEEVARMLGGSEVTDATLRAADEMISAAIGW